MIDDRLNNIISVLLENEILTLNDKGNWEGIYSEEEHSHILGDDHDYFVEVLHRTSGHEVCTKRHSIHIQRIDNVNEGAEA